jgi:uncharacterized surface protein with fasciclin (FAS1) repeats
MMTAGFHPIVNGRSAIILIIHEWLIRVTQSTNNNMKIKYIPQTLLMLSMITITPNAFSEESVAEKPTKTGTAAVKKGTLSAMIKDSVTFSTLTKALVAAELDVTLGGEGEYTIFAPTDEAFGKLPADVLAKLLLPENKEKLRSLLLYHVVPGKVLSTDLRDGDAKTMNGEKIKVDVSDDKIEIEGNKVFSADVLATNGVMHTIGKVMVPKSLEGFAGLDK